MSHFPGVAKWAFAGAHPAGDLAQSQPKTYKPQFLSDGEYALVERLTDLIIPSDDTPGAREAGVAEFVDFMIAHDHDQQYRFRTGLAWLSAHSERQLGKPFLELTEQQQVAVLEPLATRRSIAKARRRGANSSTASAR